MGTIPQLCPIGGGFTFSGTFSQLFSLCLIEHASAITCFKLWACSFNVEVCNIVWAVHLM